MIGELFSSDNTFLDDLLESILVICFSGIVLCLIGLLSVMVVQTINIWKLL